jgi:hypothetical protein
MNKRIPLLLFVLIFTLQFNFAQQVDHVQRGQRGYVPPPRYSNVTYIELKDPTEETELILSKCVEAFKLDDFQQEILKSMVFKKIEDENNIFLDKGNTRETRKKKIIDRNNLFFSDLTSILTQEEIDEYKIMDFEETAEDKKEKKKKKKRNRKKKTKS